MKTGKIIAVTVAALVTVAILATLLTKPEPEPEFGGRTLSYWVIQNIADHPRRNPEAIHALRAMGQPAVRRLTDLVEKKDSFLREQIAKHGDKLPMLNENLPSKYWDRYLATHALGAIGTNATSSLPALEKMSADPNKTLARAARSAITLVKGEPMEKLLADYLNYSDKTNSSRAFGILMELGPHAEGVIPALLAELQSTNSRIRTRALQTLVSVGAESKSCVSVMTNLLEDGDSTIRYSAVDALANSGPLAKGATPLVVRLLDDQDDLCRSSALMFLYSVVASNEFAPYQTRVQQMTNDPNETVRGMAEVVLREKLGSP